MEACKLPLLLVTNLTNIFYLTGFRGSAGVAVLGPSEGLLWVDPRYALQAREQARGVEVIEAKGGLLKAAGRWLGGREARRVAYEDSNLTCALFQALRCDCPRGVRFEPARGLIEELRCVKDQEEIRRMREAAQVTVAVFEEVVREVRPGVREGDLAAEIEYRMRQKGADGAAFETRVASGARSALPHARASPKRLGTAISEPR